VPLSGPKTFPCQSCSQILHWFKIKQRILQKILSLTYEVLTAIQTSYLYYLISVQPHRCTHSSDVVTFARPFSSYSLKVNNRTFRHFSSVMCNYCVQGISFSVDGSQCRSMPIALQMRRMCFPGKTYKRFDNAMTCYRRS